MSDTTTEVKAVLTAEDQASSVVRNFRRELDRLKKTFSELANLKLPTNLSPSVSPAAQAVTGIRAEIKAVQQRTAVEARASRQRAADTRAEAREARAVEAVRMSSIRRSMAFATRMSRQRATEERAADQERQRLEAAAERDAASSLRRRVAGDRWRFQLRERMERQERQEQALDRRETVTRARQAWGHSKDAYQDIVRPPAVAALAGTAATGAAARRILGAESSIDAAEINARIYGGLSQDAARKLRDQWAAPLAEALGTGTDKLLSSYTDALKLGIPNAGAQAFSELATKTSEAWSVPFEAVTDILGTVNSILTSKGDAFDFDKLKSVANAIQHLAAKQSTTPEKLMSFLQRGAGAAQVLGMSQEAGLAFGSASTSLGNQAGQSGRMFDYLASRLIEMPRLTKQHGEEGKQARKLIQALGYGSAEAMDRKRRVAPDDFMEDFMSRFNRIRDPKAQDQAIRFFTGREWLGEFGRMVKGIETYREASKLAKEAKGLDAIGAVWDLHRTKLGFVFKQFRAGWLNILGEFGRVLSPMARQAGDSFLAWTSKLRAGGISERFKAALDGFLEGLGFRDLKGLLEGVLGKPGEGNAGSIKAWGDAARGFGQGLRDVGNGIAAFFRVFTGGDSSPEAIGRWTARILFLSAALFVASPVIGVLGGLGSAILAFATIVGGAYTALKAMGLVGGAAASGAGAGAGAGAAAKGGLLSRLLGAFSRLAPAVAMPLTIDPSQADRDKMLERLGEWARERNRRRAGDSDTTWQDPPARHQKSSLDGDDWRGKIQPASFGGVGDLSRSIDRLGQNITGTTARAQLASLSSGITGLTNGFGGSGGSSGDAAVAGFRPPALSVPSGYGKMPAGFKGGGNSGMPDPSSGAGAGPYKAVLDHIAQSEGTAGRGDYNASLGYGKFLPGGREQNLTGKTLNEILALGNHMRRQPGNPNSSALGRYQIVGQTLRGLMRKLGLSGEEKFDEAMQDRLGAELVRQRGANDSLGSEWASLRGDKLRKAIGLAGEIPRGASTTPGRRETATPGLGQYDGLKIKGGQAIGGGGVELGVTDLARQAQANLPGGVKHFGAFNDHFHQGRRSKHNEGLAFDTTLLDPHKSSVAAEAMREKLRAAGLGDGDFKVIDEYRNPSPHSTGGHLHTQFNSAEAAKKYHAYIESLDKAAKVAEGATKSVEGFTSTGWRVQTLESRMNPEKARELLGSGTVENRGNRLVPMDAASMLSPARAASGVMSKASDISGSAAASSIPRQDPRSSGGLNGGGGGSRAGGDVHLIQNIHGAPHDPQGLASQIQRHVTEAWNYRSHDVEPELT